MYIPKCRFINFPQTRSSNLCAILPHGVGYVAILRYPKKLIWSSDCVKVRA